MAGARKHGGHRYHLHNEWITAGTVNLPDTWVYDAFAESGGATGAGTPATGYDSTAEQVVAMTLTLTANLTGQVTNYSTFRVTHRNAAGTSKNIFTVVCSTTAYVFVAFVPANLAVASGATIPGGGTGTLTIGTGVALPWTLSPGDTISLDNAIGGTGQYTGGVSVDFIVAQKGA